MAFLSSLCIFQNILAIYSWMFQHCKQQVEDNCSWCSMFIHFVYEERWWITPSNKSISRPKNQNFHPRLLCWELMNIFFPPGENWTNNIPLRQKRIFWLLRQRRNLHFILPHSFLKVTQEAKSQVPRLGTWEVLQKFKIVRFRLTYFAQIALTFDRIFYLQKH